MKAEKQTSMYIYDKSICDTKTKNYIGLMHMCIHTQQTRRHMTFAHMSIVMYLILLMVIG